MKIIFVCTGNTCRSPLAQAIAEKYIIEHDLDIEVDSAGINCNYGAPMSQNTAIITDELETFFTHTSQPLTQKKIDNADYIITMEKWQKDAIKQVCNSDKILCMADFGEGKDIADPYGGSLDIYRQTASQIEKLIPIIIEKINKT